MKGVAKAALLCFVTLPVSADEARRNPFAHAVDDTPDSDPGSEHLHEEELSVTAILVAGRKSLVNVNGNLIGLGEQKHGYWLLRVAEDSATFLHDGKMITVPLFDQPADAEHQHD